MILFKSAVTIARVAEVVFPYLVDPALRPTWSDIPMRPLSDGPIGVGSRLEATFGMGPLKPRVGVEVVTVEPGRRVVFKTFSGPLIWEGEYLLRPSGTSTELIQDARLTFTSLWRLVEPLVGESIKKDAVSELGRLKEAAEAG